MIQAFDVDRDSTLNFPEFQSLVRSLFDPALSRLTHAEIAFLLDAIQGTRKLTNLVLSSWFSDMRMKSPRALMPYPEPFLVSSLPTPFPASPQQLPSLPAIDDSSLLDRLRAFIHSNGLRYFETAL